MLDTTPEMKHLKQSLEALNAEYIELFEVRSYMLQFEENSLTARYLLTIGTHEHQLFCEKVDLMQLKFRIQLAQAAFNQNKLPDWVDIDKKTSTAFYEYYIKIYEKANELTAAKEYCKADFLNAEEAKELKEIYKILVKKLHPDLHPGQTESDKEYFIKVQAAYQLSDLKMMKQLLLYFDTAGDSMPTVELTDNLQTKVKNTKSLIDDLKSKIELLNKSFPFKYRENLSDDKWIENKQREVKSEIEMLKREIIMKTEYLLLLKSWKPELLN